MFHFAEPRISVSLLKSILCLAPTLAPTLLSRSANAQGLLPNGNQYAYVANQESNNVSGYALNAASGKLTLLEEIPFSTDLSGPKSIAVDPTGRFLYAANQYSGEHGFAGFRIDSMTGRLSIIPGSPFLAGDDPSGIAIDPSGRFVYVAALGSSGVSAFRIDKSCGGLIPISTTPYPAGPFPSSVTVDARGRFVYVTSEVGNSVSGFTIDPETGALTPISGSPFPTGAFPQSVAVDPNDRFVYVANGSSGDVSGYTLDPTTGALTALGTSPFSAGGNRIFSITVDPGGANVYVGGDGGIYAFSINQNTESLSSGFPPKQLYGQLTLDPRSPFGKGATNFVTIDYTGAFLYAANPSSNEISEFLLNADVYPSAPVSTSPGGPGPDSIALVRPHRFPLFTATEIPKPTDFGTASRFQASAINDKGEVAGSVAYYSTGEYFASGFYYAAGKTIGIFADRTSVATSLNDRSQVVGSGAVTVPIPTEPPYQAFLYNASSNQTVALDTVPEQQSYAASINNAGQITGSLSTGTCGFFGIGGGCNLGATHAFIDNGSGLVDIGALSGGYSAGTSINRRGVIVGVASVTGSNLNHLFLYARDHMVDLGTVPGMSFQNAMLNDHGMILGNSANSIGVAASYLYSWGSFLKLPLNASALNDSGEIVGSLTFANRSSHALLYYGGYSIDLNSLVDPSLPLLTSAAGVSNNGRIVASGINGNLYVLTPR